MASLTNRIWSQHAAPLDEETKKRIEENRQRALRIRAEREAAQKSKPSPQPQPQAPPTGNQHFMPMEMNSIPKRPSHPVGGSVAKTPLQDGPSDPWAKAYTMDQYIAEYGKPPKQEMSLARFVQRDVDMFKSLEQETKQPVKKELNDWHSIFKGAYQSSKRRKINPPDDASAPPIEAPKSEISSLAAASTLETASHTNTFATNQASPVPRTLLSNFKQIPPGLSLAPLESTENFMEWTSSVLEQPKIVCAALHRSLMSSFRRAFKPGPVGKVKFEDDCVNINDSFLGIAFLFPNQHKPLWLPLDEQSDTGPVSNSMKWDFMISLLESSSVEKIIFNVQKFLLAAVQAKGEDFLPDALFDPMIAAWVDDPELASWEFDDLQTLYLKPIGVDQPLRAGETNMNAFCRDVLQCRLLAETIRDVLERADLMSGFRFEMTVPIVLAKMESAGMGFDFHKLGSYRQLLENRCEELTNQVEKLVGARVLLSSPLQVARLLFDQLGLTYGGKKVSSATQSTNDRVLRRIENQHPVVALIREHREASKLLSQYVYGLERYAASDRLRCRWMQTNTATGRVSTISPNMQAMAKGEVRLKVDSFDDDDGLLPLSVFEDIMHKDTQEPASNSSICINIRDAFCARPGYTLVALDYSQIEARVLAHIAQDEGLSDFFRQRKDIHRLVASRCYGKPESEITSRERQHGKGIVFGIVYGMGPPALARSLNITVAEAENFIQKYLGGFPAVYKFIRDTKSHAHQHGEVRTMMGRRRKLKDINSADIEKKGHHERCSVNTRVQGSAAEVVKRAMLRIDEARRLNPEFKNSKLILQIHDELVFEVENTIRDEFVSVVIDCMQNCVEGFSVPLEMSMSFGQRWGSMTSVNVDEFLAEYSAKPTPWPQTQLPDADDTIPLDSLDAAQLFEGRSLGDLTNEFSQQ